MILGKVVGTVVSTRKDEALVGYKLLIVQAHNPLTGEDTEQLVAVDTVGAGIGEQVLVTRGSAARVTLPDTPPTDAAIVGIVDYVDF
jgi:ethanolamine utilization protein EutN